MKLTGSLPLHDMIASGPLIEAIIETTPDNIATLLAANRPAPPPIRATLMIDIGAQATVIENAVATQLGLRPDRYSLVTGVSQQAQSCAVYLVVIGVEMLDEAGQRKVVAVDSEIIGVDSPPSPHPHVGLLGRDFLQHFEFTYRGHLGSFELIFTNPLPTK